MGRLPCWLPRGQHVLYSSCKVMTYTSQEWSIHPGFQTRSRHNQRCKTVFPQKDLDLWHPKMYLKETSTSSLWNSRKGGVQETLNLQKKPCSWPSFSLTWCRMGPWPSLSRWIQYWPARLIFQPASWTEWTISDLIFSDWQTQADPLERVLQRSKQMETNWLMLVLWVCCQKVSFPGFWKLLKN